MGNPEENHYLTKLSTFASYKMKPVNLGLKSLTDELNHVNSMVLVNLMKKLLDTDPTKRISAKDALKHAFFTSSEHLYDKDV